MKVVLTRHSWTRFVLLLVFGISALWNVAFVSRYGDRFAPYNLQIDSEIYYNLASDLVRTGSPAIPPTHAPGFIVFLAAIYWIFGVGLLAPKLVFVGCVALTAILTYSIGKRLFGGITGVVSGAIVSLSPLLRAYSATLQYEIFVMLLVTATTYLAFRAADEAGRGRRNVWWGLCGIFFGLSCLSRETVAILAPVFASWILLTHQSQKTRLTSLVCFLFPFACGVGGWIIFQYFHTGLLVPISSKGSINFLIGNNPNATGTFNLVSTSIAEPKGFDFIRQMPLEFFRLTLRKILYYFGIIRDGWAVPEPLAWYLSLGLNHRIPFAWTLAIVRSFLPIAALIGLLLPLVSRRRSPDHRSINANYVLAGMILFLALPHFVMISSVRFVIPAYPLMVLLAARGIVDLLRLRTVRFVSAAFFVVLSVSAAIGQFYRVGGSYDISSESLEGSELVLQRNETTETVTISPRPADRPAAFINEEYFGAGPLSLSLTFEDIGGSGKVLFLANDFSTVCEAEFFVEAGTRTVHFPCYLARSGVVKPLIYSLGPKPLVVSSASVRFGESAAKPESAKILFIEGWGASEQDPGGRVFRWSISDSVALYIPATVSDNLSILFDGNVFGGPGMQADLYVNDAAAGTITFDQKPWHTYRLAVPASLLTQKENLLKLSFSRTKRPCDVSATTDCRQLALAVSNLRIAE